MELAPQKVKCYPAESKLSLTHSGQAQKKYLLNNVPIPFSQVRKICFAFPISCAPHEVGVPLQAPNLLFFSTAVLA